MRPERDGRAWLRNAVAAACGALLTVALPPVLFWPALLALVPILHLTASSATVRKGFGIGFWAGIGFFPLYLLWLPASLSQPDWFGPFFWALFPPLVLIVSAFWGIVTGGARLIGGGGWPTLLVLPAAWVLMEWGRTQGYFAFPWGTLGYAWLDTPVSQLAGTIGVHGLSLLALSLAALLAAPLQGRGRFTLAAPALAVLLGAGAWLAGAQRLQVPLPEPTRTALLVQPNLDPFGRLGTPTGDLQILTRLTATGTTATPAPDLIVWPEGALVGIDIEAGASTWVHDQIAVAAGGTRTIIGGRGSDAGGTYNSAWLLEDAALAGRYDKTVLVPFGERWPLMEQLEPAYRWLFGLLQIGLLQNTTAGARAVSLGQDPGLGVYICYESVFPQVTSALVRDGAQVLVNITNDAWFARGNGARQHYDMGRMRAIETHRYVLRSGLDGITGVVDPLGRSVSELPRNVPDTILVAFEPSDVVTDYVRYGGLLVPLLLGWILLAAAGRFLLQS